MNLPSSDERRVPLSRLRARLVQHLSAGRSEGRVVWTDLGDELLLHLDALEVAAAPPVLLVTIPVECRETGRVPLTVGIALAGPEDDAGLVAMTEHLPRGHRALATRWGPLLQEGVWGALLAAGLEQVEGCGSLLGLRMSARTLHVATARAR